MTTFPGSPRLLRGGIVQFDVGTASVKRIIALQYNPDTLTRTFQIKGAGAENGDRSEALRLKGPPVETIKLEAEIDATDQLADGDQQTVRLGIHPQLAVLETIIYPSSSQLIANNSAVGSGTLEIAATETALTLFIWSKSRILPVRLTELSITEEAFDVALNPIRAKVSIGMRVLTVDDLGFAHRGGSMFISALLQKERLAASRVAGTFATLGIEGI